MAINPKTMPYTEYPELIEIWESAYEAIWEKEEPAIYLPIGTKKEAQHFQHTANMIRAAIRAQTNDDKLYSLATRMVELEGDVEWGLKFFLRGEPYKHITKHNLLNSKGEPI